MIKQGDQSVYLVEQNAVQTLIVINMFVLL